MRRIIRSSKGASLVEYGILVGLISVLAIGAVLGLGRQTETSFKAPTAVLGWYVNGITEDYAARYRFTAEERSGNPDYIGVDVDGLSGAPYGGLNEATFDEFNLRMIQYRISSGALTVVLSGDTTSTISGHQMSCMDLSLGDSVIAMDFDTASEYYDDIGDNSRYTTTLSEAPFALDQELACVIETK